MVGKGERQRRKRRGHTTWERSRASRSRSLSSLSSISSYLSPSSPFRSSWRNLGREKTPYMERLRSRRGENIAPDIARSLPSLSGMAMMVASPSIFRATTARKGGPGLSNFFSMVILGMLIYVIFGSIIHSVCNIEIGSDAVNSNCGIMRFLRDMGDDLSFKGYEPNSYVYRSTGVTREGLTPKSDKPSTSLSKEDDAKEDMEDSNEKTINRGMKQTDENLNKIDTSAKDYQGSETETYDACQILLSFDLEDMLEKIRNNDEIEDIDKYEKESQVLLNRLKCVESMIMKAEIENKKVALLSKEVSDMTNLIKSSMNTADKKRSEMKDKMKAQGVDGKFMGAAEAKPEDML